MWQHVGTHNQSLAINKTVTKSYVRYTQLQCKLIINTNGGKFIFHPFSDVYCH